MRCSLLVVYGDLDGWSGKFLILWASQGASVFGGGWGSFHFRFRSDKGVVRLCG